MPDSKSVYLHCSGVQPVAPALTLPLPADMSGVRPYLSQSAWNTPIPNSPTIDSNSTNMIATILASDNGKLKSAAGAYTYPVYFADATTPLRTITTSNVSRRYNEDGTYTGGLYSFNIPIPAGAVASSGDDAQMIVIERHTGTEWDIYRFEYYNPNEAARISQYVKGIVRDGQPLNYSSRGAGVPYYAGLIRPWEIAAGEINHALAFAYLTPRQTRCVYPAVQTDGASTDTNSIPEGARLQLDPSLDVNAISGLSAAGKVIARALQVYGMFCIDISGSNKIYPEDSKTAVWGTTLNVSTVDPIPVSSLRVLQLPTGYTAGTYTPNYGGCVQ